MSQGIHDVVTTRSFRILCELGMMLGLLVACTRTGTITGEVFTVRSGQGIALAGVEVYAVAWTPAAEREWKGLVAARNEAVRKAWSDMPRPEEAACKNEPFVSLFECQKGWREAHPDSPVQKAAREKQKQIEVAYFGRASSWIGEHASAQGLTGIDGRYTLEGLPRGHYVVAAQSLSSVSLFYTWFVTVEVTTSLQTVNLAPSNAGWAFD